MRDIQSIAQPRPTARFTRATAATMLLAASLACTALAAPQSEDVAAPPQPDRAQSLPTPVLGYAVMAIFFAAIIGVSLIPAKRGHQD